MDIARELAVKVLYKIEKEDGYTNIVLDEILNKNREKLNSKDIGLISEIIYGTITWKLTIDEIIKKHSKIKMKKISAWILNILRIGIYQIVFLDKIPKSASVNESVNLAKKYGHKGSSNFVNALLRKIEKTDYQEFFTIENDVERISKTTSMPEWIIEELLKEKSVQEVEEICKASNLRPKVNIRVNKLKISKNELEKLLEEEKIEFSEGILKDFLILEKVKNIENLDLFKNGYFTIQDEMAGLIAQILEPKENEKILDCCSAPGGKTTYIAELMNNKGYIEAWDIHDHRLKLVENTSKRLGINIIKTKLQDATIYNDEYFEKFDKLLLDVPCLGLGVLKRKPDIKWKRKKEDIEEITLIQKNILQTCSNYVKKGGEIIYSTCSILKNENQDIIQEFLNNNLNFQLKKINCHELNLIDQNYISLQQNKNNDGFFICKLLKK